MTTDLAAALTILRDAPHVTIHAVGFVAATPPEMLAYLDVRAAGDRVRHELDALLREGSPSGRVYAALLLEAIDPEAGRGAWTSLRDDPAPTAVHCGGCMPHFPTTIATFASAVLAAGSAEAAMAISGEPPWARP